MSILGLPKLVLSSKARGGGGRRGPEKLIPGQLAVHVFILILSLLCLLFRVFKQSLLSFM